MLVFLTYSMKFYETDSAIYQMPVKDRHLFNGPLSRTARVSHYWKGKTNQDLLEQETVSGTGMALARPYANLHLTSGR